MPHPKLAALWTVTAEAATLAFPDPGTHRMSKLDMENSITNADP